MVTEWLQVTTTRAKTGRDSQLLEMQMPDLLSSPLDRERELGAFGHSSVVCQGSRGTGPEERIHTP